MEEGMAVHQRTAGRPADRAGPAGTVPAGAEGADRR
nr:MAG TPA: hypothetical protein [Caudoviricetes sp.]